MRLLFLPAIMAVVAGMISSVYSQPSVGSLAPDISGTDNSGQTHSLSDYSAKVVLLELWFNT